MERILDFMRNNIYFVATVDDDQAMVRPFGAPLFYEGDLYIFTGKGKNVWEQMQKYPKIQIAGIDKDGNWLRLTAEAEMVDDEAIVAAFLEDDPALKEDYAVGDGVAQPVKLNIKSAVMNSESQPQEILI
ncbi:MAG: pyridoxamine 5'-phosphate oxidase family protein [Candidatus Saccharimonadales bacterium]